MRLLERASGTPIVELTEPGRVLLKHTDEILARFDAAYADVSSLETRIAGAVRVAGLDQFAPGRIARALSLFRERHPFARVLIEQLSCGPVDLQVLEEGTVDLLVCERSAAEQSLRQAVLDEDEYVLLVPAGSSLARRRKRIGVAELASLRPIVPRSCAARSGLEAQLHARGVERHRSLQPESVETAQELVANGFGAAIAPSRLINAQDPRTSVISLAHLLPPHVIVLLSDPDQNHSTAVQWFADALRDVCRFEDGGESEATDRNGPRQVAAGPQAA